MLRIPVVDQLATARALVVGVAGAFAGLALLHLLDAVDNIDALLADLEPNEPPLAFLSVIGAYRQ
jgi:hypothetical protein